MRIVSGDESGHLLIWKTQKTAKSKSKSKSSFDEDEMPANILLMGSSKVCGLVLTLTGMEVALQKGTLMALDFLHD
jgi:hypothetical protein